MDEMDTAKFNTDGKFRTAAGTDDLQAIDGAEILLPPETEGLVDYEPGDEVDIHIKGRVKEPTEEGKTPIEAINIKVQDMPSSAKMYRRDQKNNMPPPQTMKKGADLDDEDM
jgi:hypothetical protein